VGPAISRSGRSPGRLLSEITNRVVAFMHGSALTSAIRNTGHADGDPDSIFDFRFGLSSGRSGSQITATARATKGQSQLVKWACPGSLPWACERPESARWGGAYAARGPA
jgi:hypothetical protein